MATQAAVMPKIKSGGGGDGPSSSPSFTYLPTANVDLQSSSSDGVVDVEIIGLDQMCQRSQPRGLISSFSNIAFSLTSSNPFAINFV